MGLPYDNPKVAKRLKSIKESIQKANHKKLSRLFNEFNADAVICTQAFPCGLVADFKKATNLDTRLVGVLTDSAPHAYWLHEGVDLYVVPSLDSQEGFIQKGISKDRIKAFGIPVDPKFTLALDKKAIARKLGLTLDTPTILIMGGGQGLGPIKKIVKSLMKLKNSI